MSWMEGTLLGPTRINVFKSLWSQGPTIHIEPLKCIDIFALYFTFPIITNYKKVIESQLNLS